MPWTPRDAYSHTRKASTPSLQRRWASVANSALSEGHDDASAIRMANAAVENMKPSMPRKMSGKEKMK